MVQGTRHKVQGTRYKVQGTRHKVQGTRYKVQGTRYKVQGTRHKVQGTRYKAQGTRFKVQDTRLRLCLFLVPCFLCFVTYFWQISLKNFYWLPEIILVTLQARELGFFILSLLYIIELDNAAVWDGRVDFPDIFNTKKLVCNK
jgi:hypothetical protein